MQARIANANEVAPNGYAAMIGLERYIKSCGLEKPMVELMKMRASQINGCAFCLDMHWKDARAAGESEQRLYGLDAWQESPYYTERERAALLWTEAVTRVADGHVPDEVYEKVKPHFGDKELVDLTIVVAAINAWNRLAISLRVPPGMYPAPKHG